jgi:hypothetical protein
MNTTELDEAQGLTEEALIAYVTKKGWRPILSGRVFLLEAANTRLSLEVGMDEALQRLARLESRSVQALLREMNPRMQKGLPSNAAREAHRGLWIGHMGGKFPSVCIGFFTEIAGVLNFRSGPWSWDSAALVAASIAEWPCRFWPCDDAGNKLLWPKNADGVLL